MAPCHLLGQDKESQSETLTRGRLLVKNAVGTLGAHGISVIAGLVAMPILVARLDDERFGLLTLAWAAFGYAAMLDLGIGRATTKVVAGRIAEDRRAGPALWTALALLVFPAVLVGAALALTSRPIATLFDVPAEMVAEVSMSARLVGLGVVAVVLSAALRGALQALQRVDLINYVRVPVGVITFAGPAVVAASSAELHLLLLPIIVVRVAGLLVYAVACAKVVPGFFSAPVFDREARKELLGFGAWVTLSNLVSSLMTYMDRFLLPLLMPLALVGYYTAPAEVLLRVSVVPAAISAVLFPALVVTQGSDAARAAALYHRAFRSLLGLMGSVILGLAFAGPWLFGVWLGPDFGGESGMVVQLLAAGLIFNTLAYLPYTLLQAVGSARLVAVVHLIEFPIYLGLLLWLAPRWGPAGVAGAFASRLFLDFVLLTIFAARSRPWAVVPWRAVATVLMAGFGAVLATISPLRYEEMAMMAIPLVVLFLVVFVRLVDKGELREARRLLRSGSDARKAKR